MNTQAERSELPGKEKSYWVDTVPGTDFSPLSGTVQVDVAILGGGIAGLTSAVLLKEAGLTVAVVEARRVARLVTGHTTAKLTSAHEILYNYLASHFGKEQARQYADANEAAIGKVESFIERNKIACDFTRTPAYTYTVQEEEKDELKAEAEAAQSLGLPAAYTEDVPLPFKAYAAVRFDRQARFHPLKYLYALIRPLPGEGSHIFENTRALEVREGDLCEVTADRGVIKARNVIVATHFPFLFGGEFYAKMYPKQSYVLGVRLNGAAPEGLFFSTDENYNTIRPHTVEGDTIMLVGGMNHKTGQGGDIIERYKKLEEFSRRHFDVRSIDYHWTTQDNETMDGVPYIGRLSKASRRTYVATGFGGWGMTNGTVAGMVLSDMILGRENPWQEVFDSTRIKPAVSAKRFIGQNLNVAKEYVKGSAAGGADEIFSMARGEGRIINIRNEKAAVYKDDDGALHAVSSKCTHMGCTVKWDNAHRTWDCPCHGSRFTYDGEIVYGPAIKPLARMRIEEEPSGERRHGETPSEAVSGRKE